MRVNGFFGHVKANDQRSVLMFAGFVGAYQVAFAVLLAVPLMLFDWGHNPLLHPLAYLWRYGLPVTVLSVVLFGWFFLFHVAALQDELDFHLVTRVDEHRLVGIVERLALTAGVPRPRVGVIEDPALNAFACGLSPQSAVVVVTRGLLRALDDDELAAVVAHEVAHILHGDIRLIAMSHVAVSNLQGLQLIGAILLPNRGWFAGLKRQPMLLVLSAPFWLPLLLWSLPLVLVFTGLKAAGKWLNDWSLSMARVTRLMISSSREYIADAEAVRLTHNPAALISALRRIDGHSDLRALPDRADAMMIAGAVEGPWATHPTMDERVATLVRLAGGMALIGGGRRDTRSLADRRAGVSRGFGRKAVDPSREMPATPQPRALSDRVREQQGRSRTADPDFQRAPDLIRLMADQAATLENEPVLTWPAAKAMISKSLLAFGLLVATFHLFIAH